MFRKNQMFNNQWRNLARKIKETLLKKHKMLIRILNNLPSNK